MPQAGQKKRDSLLESVCNQVLGGVVAFAVQVFVIVPVWDLELTIYDNLSVTAIFSIASLIRSYVLRRLFNIYTR